MYVCPHLRDLFLISLFSGEGSFDPGIELTIELDYTYLRQAEIPTTP